MQYRDIAKQVITPKTIAAAIPGTKVSELAKDGQVIPENHVITVSDRNLSVDNARLVQHNVKTDTMTLQLDGEWDGMASVIIILGSGEEAKSFLWEGEPIIIPGKFTEEVGSFPASVVGLDAEGLTRLVTVAAPAVFRVVESGEYIGSVPPEDQPDLLGKIVAAADDATSAAEEARAAAEDAENAASDIGDPISVGRGVPTEETNSSMYIDVESYNIYKRQ